METITSKENPKVKELVKLLASKKDRKEAGLFVLEGLRLALDAVRSGVFLERLYLSPPVLERHPEEAEELRRGAGELVLLSEDLARRVGDTQSPQGVFALCKMLDNWQSIATIRKDGCYLLLSGLQDPGNLGTILRAAEALGVDGVFLDKDCPELTSPKVLRASMGGVFRLTIALCGGMGETIERLRREGISVWAAALREDAAMLGKDAFPQGCGVLIGNEGHGLSQELIGLCDSAVTIPMAGGAESLNAASAASILLWEMTRSKRRQ